MGWASLSEWSNKKAYDISAEISLYVKLDWHGKGIGTALTEAILAAGRCAGVHSVIARIAGGNEASLHILDSLGFGRVGVLREIGRKFGQLLDVHLLQKIISDNPGTPAP